MRKLFGSKSSSKPWHRRFPKSMIALGLIALVFGLWFELLPIPNRHNPLGYIEFDQAPNWSTRFKITRLSYQPEKCLATLKNSQLKYQLSEAFQHPNGCRQINPVKVQSNKIRFNAAFILTCPAAVSWALFEQNGLQTAAKKYLNEEISQVEHFGTYACRNQYHAKNAPLSEHASANAIDIAGFKTRDGKSISVLKDWPKNSNEAKFLRAARDHACQSFNAVLSPDYNAAHHNHFHFDRGIFISCS